ncbi:Biotin--protein ligase [Erysiphe neolycopersici]|uniref:Biotin--protein ligase n=1 Tax=Erysiphe neolycopersici TaxID=212602 RepID=A0A420HSL5_9PEZI|nr:Biotin--protein ligase [Erysiphe neolycopersici]
MMNRKVDVLIYSGLGSSTDSVRHCLYSLRRLLSPNYAVIPVTERTILKEPWTKSCALLVFPGGADTGYCKSLNGDGNRIIDQYVRRGGAYLGFCAGGYFGSSRCEFEVGNKLLEVVGSRELSFFPGTCRGCAFEGFEYDSEAGAKAVEIIIPGHVLGSTTTAYKFKSYYNGGGVFVDAAKYSDKNVEILGRYNGPLNVNGGDGNAAVVYCRVNKGKVILTGPHPEFAAANLDTKSKIPSYLEIIKELAENDYARVLFLKACLTKLGLSVNQEDQPIHSLSRLHLSSIQHELVPKLLSSWQTIITTHDDDDGKEFIEAENDTFYLEDPDFKYGTECTTTNKSHSKHLENESNGSIDTYGLISRDNKNQVSCGSTIKHLVLHKKKWPNVKETPKFNHEVFFTSLKEFQDEKGSKADEFGKFLLYGEVVTSTNTILELNPKLLSQLPTGFTFTATTQVAGRGRGSNLWVSPGGSLNMSVYIKHPLALNATAPVIFVQYVAAMAIVQGIHSYEKGFENLPVKLKWPNDIYIKDPSKISSFSRTSSNENDNDLKSYIKVGGILINSSCIDENFHLVVGIGLNTTNDAPTTSLNSLLKHSMYKKSNSQNRSSPYTSSPSPQSYCELYFTPEKLLARILTCFETLYKKFCLNGFDSSFHTLYYSYWLHTNQIVTLETEGCARVRIKGITSDWGLLKVEELSIHEDRPTGKIWNLQSDCNSFDFFKGLLKAKN